MRRDRRFDLAVKITNLLPNFPERSAERQPRTSICATSAPS
jgi:hypothetical protein